MNKYTLIAIGIIVILAGGALYWVNTKTSTTLPTQISDYKNTSYIINGFVVKLNNGIAETETAPGSASKTITRYFGNEVEHDFDGDGRTDVAFLLTQSTGGSGTFYYVVAALNTAGGYVGSQALFLGDRIAPQTTNMGKGNIIIVNYADRNPGESFSVQPSIGKSIWLLLDPKTMQFGEVAQNFEGEADPQKMNLLMKTWDWVGTTFSDGTSTAPRVKNKFTLTFKDNKTFSASTDCNGVGGEYTTKNNTISFSKMMSTLMYCEGSQESEFTNQLLQVETYSFTSKGELIFTFKLGKGTMTFK